MAKVLLFDRCNGSGGGARSLPFLLQTAQIEVGTELEAVSRLLLMKLLF